MEGLQPRCVPDPPGLLVGPHRRAALDFAPLCRDLLAELASPIDERPKGLTIYSKKMALYQANGARLGLLHLPEERVVDVWPGSKAPQRLERPEVLDAGREIPALRLNLGEIWAG